MMTTSFEKCLAQKKALIITLDNALYPEKDYLLQVYYLFSEFMAYTEQHDAKLMLDFMKEEFEKNGAAEVFNKAATKFGIDTKFEHNFNLLFETARLPLKLLMYQRVLEVLQQLVAKGKRIFLLAEGNPMIAINKIKQLEWHGLDKNLGVYFSEEYNKSMEETVQALMANENIEPQDIAMLMSETQLEKKYLFPVKDCFSVAEIL